MNEVRGSSLLNAAEVIAWLGARRFPFAVRDLAGAMEVCNRTALRHLRMAEVLGWVQIERVHRTKCVYRSLIRITKRDVIEMPLDKCECGRVSGSVNLGSDEDL